MGSICRSACVLSNLRGTDEASEAIYFDGVLPERKRETRIDRLQAYIDKLVTFKAVHDEATKGLKNSRNRVSPEQVEQQLDNVRKSTPPPPFLVFAAIDALRQSKYASRTYVVDGEADEFCAAHALEISPASDSSLATTIFTNDSDLIVYGLGDSTRIVQINDMSYGKDEHQDVLHGLEFCE